jgi:hypothetical protein
MVWIVDRSRHLTPEAVFIGPLPSYLRRSRASDDLPTLDNIIRRDR